MVRAGVQEGGKGGGKPLPWGLEVWRIGRKEDKRKDLHARREGSADLLLVRTVFDIIG